MSTKVRKPRVRRELARQPEFRQFDASRLEVRAASGSESGLTEVRGSVIVYDTAYEVYDMWGSFTETIRYGAAAPVLSNADLDVRFLVNHDPSQIHARSTAPEARLVLTDTIESLDVTVYLDPALSADLCTRLERGLITQMSVGMEVDPAGDVWSGEDEHGMPNVRDIFRLANIFDASAVTYPASPTTTIGLSRMWSALPVESRERTRILWDLARSARVGRDFSQHDADVLMHTLEELYEVDTTGDPGEGRAAPTDQDAKVASAIASAHDAVTAALQAQSKDPDNGTDPVDEQVWTQLQAANSALVKAIKAQGTDSAPEAEETKDDGTDEGDADGTADGGDGNAPGVGSDDGTGSRSVDLPVDEVSRAAESNAAVLAILDIDRDRLRLARRVA